MNKSNIRYNHVQTDVKFVTRILKITNLLTTIRSWIISETVNVKIPVSVN